DAAQHSINAARAGHLSTITASLSRGKTTAWLENGSYNALGATGNGRYGTTIGVTLSVPIFSGGATQSKVRQSIYQRDEAQDSLELTRRQVTQNMLDVLTSIQQLTQAQSTYSVARHQLVLNRLLLKQSAGTIDYNDLEY